MSQQLLFEQICISSFVQRPDVYGLVRAASYQLGVILAEGYRPNSLCRTI